jgi:hypothetical protein
MLKTSFLKLEKHSPTRLYMIYPMLQSVARFCVEKEKKLILQRHCPLSLSSKNKKLILPRSIFLSFEYVTHACPAFTPQRGLLAQPTATACKQEALPAKV